MATGRLVVELSSAFEAIPIVGARVEYFLEGILMGTLVTDASGHKQPLELEAPERCLALDESYSGLVYSTCDIRVYANRYRTTIVNGIQIYAGETVLEPLELEPFDIVATPSARTTLSYDIPQLIVNDDTEWSSADEQCISARILDRVVIPQYITVHLGTPTSSAQNVTVTFRNYIKNVCCSEIYSTWPENSLRANIYCQISLALNRIFTEWYPSRGYAFDITNSTQFDQYYVHGRSIAENVSKLVDELFDQYIKKDGRTEPFYAEYCNGTTATCPGLKQWGTVTLAQQGYSALGILKYYYGSSIGIYTASAIAGTTSSWGGTSLKIGSSGSAVTTIQTQLLRIRKNYPLIPTLTVDGVFGSATEAAVKKFQTIFNLTSDGIVGKTTWYKISYIYAAVLKLAELTSEGIPEVPGSPPSTVLRVGSTGERVSLAQYILSLAADYYEDLDPVAIDGVFGTGTYNAVVEFQTLRGLTADGVIGPATWEQLYELYYSAFNSIVSPSVPYPGTVLQNGSSGTSVSTIQRFLNVIAGAFPSIGTLTVDGKYGSATTTSVRTFQTLFGLTVDGKVGPTTWTAIVNVYDNLVQ